MRASSTFTVENFVPVNLPVSAGPDTAISVAVATMTKQFTGEVSGRSTTVFTYTLDPASNAGGYVAMESFDGSVHGRTGTFTFTHSATTSGVDRNAESFTIIPSNGTGELAGISGGGGITVDPDGTHHLWFDYELPE